MADAPTNANHRVTNAIISTKLDNLIDEVRELRETACKRLDANEERSRTNATNIARLDERQKATTGILGAIQALTIAVATWLGIN